MPTITLNCPVHDSFRVQQIAGMFDVPITKRATRRIAYELPDLRNHWSVGLIVGPSASGKSTTARRLFRKPVTNDNEWPIDAAVIDCLGDHPIKKITHTLTSVGFGSPPSWIKPYHVLSTGEKFRANLARCLLDAGSRTVVFDEFTSVVDRNVAQVASAAVAKAIRSNRLPARFVAVSCHYDIIPWLAPDWILDMATGKAAIGPCTTNKLPGKQQEPTIRTVVRSCSRSEPGARSSETKPNKRSLRPPKIQLHITRCHRDVWQTFAPHHYLSSSLNPASRCYVALWNKTPVAFCATLSIIGRKNHRRISRLVTLPDYQGIGIGTATLRTVADLHRREGHRINITTSHPAMIDHLRHNPDWRTIDVKRTGTHASRRFRNSCKDSIGRAVVSFEYTP